MNITNSIAFPRKVLSLSLFFLSSLSLSAQDAAVLTAWENLGTYERERENNEEAAINALLEAKENIDGAVLNDATRGKSKTWKRRGDVYWFIYTDKSPRLLLHKDGAADTAAASYMRALVVEKRGNGKPKIEDAADIGNKLLTYGNSLFEQGLDKFNNSDFKASDAAYQKAFTIFQALSNQDPENEGIQRQLAIIQLYRSMALFNGGEKEKGIAMAKEAMEAQPKDTVMTQNLISLHIANEDYEKAKEVIQISNERFGENPDLYMMDIRLALLTGDNARAGELIAKGKEKFPQKRAEIVLEEVNFHLEQKNDEKALAAINEAIEAFQETDEKDILKVLYFNKGVVNDKIVERLIAEDPKANAEIIAKRRKEAEEGYAQTLELDPSNTGAYLQLANGIISKANVKLNEANALDLSETEKYEALKAEATELFKESAVMLEKAYSVEKAKESPDPSRMSMIRSTLMQVYTKTGNMERFKELKAEEGK